MKSVSNSPSVLWHFPGTYNQSVSGIMLPRQLCQKTTSGGLAL